MKKVYTILKSQKVGIITGFTITGLLIIGSLIMNYYPRHYAGLHGEDISFFFIHKKPIHTWFYLLFLACVLYGINASLCTLDSIIKKAKRGIRKIPLYGASIVHIGFVITLVAHLVGGLYSSTEPAVPVSDKWTAVAGAEMKITDLKTSSYPNGMPKIIEASVTVRKDGKEYADTLGYNNPVLLRRGATGLLMADYGWVPSGVVVKIDDRTLSLRINEPFTINNNQMRIADLYMPPQFRYPVVKLISINENQNRQQIYVPIGEGNGRSIGGAHITIVDVNTAPGVLVNVKNNPSIPLTFVAIVFFSTGMILVIMRVVGIRNYTEQQDRLPLPSREVITQRQEGTKGMEEVVLRS
ncbi:MAG: hypothetical protein E3K32_13665 [wastewater metagenome]|nr:hypothetical protein [Candidatus Loosdrechtia aerotolerans]